MKTLTLPGGYALPLTLTVETYTAYEAKDGALPQQQAQGVNLLYFLPTAATGLLFHMKNKMIRWEIVLPAVITGCVAAAGAAWLAQQIELNWLRKGFGAFLLLAGLMELKKTRQTPKSDA